MNVFDLLQASKKVTDPRKQIYSGFANGCGAHVMNLLIKDICSLTEFEKTLADAMVVIKFVHNHQPVLSAFQTKRETYKIKHDLILVVPIRWYSHYNACRYLRAAKFAVQALPRRMSPQF
ncbi:hypothetical protein PHMEG_00016386 [Phytophthora megakarya]|uniref:DUF659 domain-containing protein n=1 Tax=Phytophthora megakarya TaxID=4795 RepID=A0A225VZ50_9STRA|nr:hypothetical protein PHMEG_00016386 [Phytophthora megakarya]